MYFRFEDDDGIYPCTLCCANMHVKKGDVCGRLTSALNVTRVCQECQDTNGWAQTDQENIVLDYFNYKMTRFLTNEGASHAPHVDDEHFPLWLCVHNLDPKDKEECNALEALLTTSEASTSREPLTDGTNATVDPEFFPPPLPIAPSFPDMQHNGTIANSEAVPTPSTKEKSVSRHGILERNISGRLRNRTVLPPPSMNTPRQDILDAAARSLLPPNLEMIPVPRDGNCMFHALVIGSPQAGLHHMNLRQRIVAHVIQHWDDTATMYGEAVRSKFPQETCVTYQARMLGRKRNGGDYPELVAAACLLDTSIVIINHVHGNDALTRSVIHKPSCDAVSDSERCIHLLRVGENHYHGGNKCTYTRITYCLYETTHYNFCILCVSCGVHKDQNCRTAAERACRIKGTCRLHFKHPARRGSHSSFVRTRP